MEFAKIVLSSLLSYAALDLSEFMVMCREQGYFNLADIHTAVFEYNGKLDHSAHQQEASGHA